MADGMSAIFASGVLGSGVAGAAAAPGVPGVGGLFGQLLTLGGGAQGQVPGGMLGVGPEGAPVGPFQPEMVVSEPLVALLGQVAPELAGEGELVVEGSAQSMTLMVQQVQVVVTQLQAAGVSLQNLGDDVRQLAGALHVLGMPMDQAAHVAEKITQAMALMKQIKDMDVVDTQALALLLVSSAVGQGEAAGVGAVKHWHVEVREERLDVRSVTMKIKDGWAKDEGMAVDALAQQLLGVAGLVAPIALPPEVSVEGEDALLDASAARVQVILQKDGFVVTALGGAGERAVVRHPDVEELAVQAAEVAQPSALSLAAPAASVAVVAGVADGLAKTVSRVGAAEVLDKPVGEVMYDLRADAQGVETLKATPAVQKVLETEMAPDRHVPAGQWVLGAADASAAAVPAASAMAHGLGAYSDRLAAAMRYQVTQQAVIQFGQVAKDGGGVVRMALHPQDLGEIRIDLTVRDGAVHGTVSASDAAVVEVLAREVHVLRQSLHDAGLRLGEQGLSLMLSQQDARQGGHGQGQRQGGLGGHEAVVEDVEGLRDQALDGWVSPDRLVDVQI